jgi:anti-sigma factor RsiW
VLCPESLRVQAYFDGEVDAVSAVEIERHMERCPECRELQQNLDRTRTALRRELTNFRIPSELGARLNHLLDQAEAVSPMPSERPARVPWRGRAFWAGAFGGAGLSALAALCLFMLLPLRADPLIDDLLSAHLRSLMPTHLIEVVSSDKHTVKPWFAGRTDVSPEVADFDQQGYRLVGGRADYLDRQRSAVMVYQHGPHIVNVFSWAADRRSVPNEVTRNGYHLLFWRTGDLEYCAVSDTGWDELQQLARLIQGLGARDRAQ